LFSAAAVTFPLTIIGHKTLKITTRRPRPSDVIPEIQHRVRPPDRFSFPSGHTASAFAVARLLSAFYPFCAIPCYTFASLVGISRVRNGVHYPGDVIAGFILGMVIPGIAFLIVL
jgi:undecaprenyl-diphosphatase